MRTISPVQWQEMRRGAAELARNDAGGITLRAADGSYLKRFRRPRLLSSAHFIPLSSRFSRAAKEIEKRGIRTVRVLEVFRIPGGQHVVNYAGVEGASLQELIAQASDPSDEAALLERFATFIALLHEKGIYFRGLRFDNVIVGDDGEFALIDVAAVRLRRAPLRPGLRGRNLRRLLASPHERAIVDRAGMSRFIHAYFEAAGLDAAGRRAIVRRLNVSPPAVGKAENAGALP